LLLSLALSARLFYYELVDKCEMLTKYFRRKCYRKWCL